VLDAYSLFNTTTNYPFGGAEYRAFTFLTELKKLSFDVSAIVRNYGQHLQENYNEIQVYAHPYHTSPEIAAPNYLRRLLSLKWSGKSYENYLKHNAYNIINAGIYCAFEITSATLLLADYCKKNKKQFYLFIASDGEVSYGKLMPTSKEIIKQVIDSAEKIFVQNNTQLKNLKVIFGKEGILIKNPIDLSRNESNPVKEYDFLWIGKSNIIKRPELFTALAKQLSHYRFCMLMNVSDKRIHEEILKQKPGNLTVIEYLNLNETEELLKKTKIFVSTSLLEGFPNTFLQAGKFKIPVISMLINPDNFLTEHNCGLYIGDDLSKLTLASEQLINDSSLYNLLSTNIYNYVLKNHEAGQITKTLAGHFA